MSAVKQGSTLDIAQRLADAPLPRAMLESRFGALPDDMAGVLAALDQPALMELLHHVATDSLEQPRAHGSLIVCA